MVQLMTTPKDTTDQRPVEIGISPHRPSAAVAYRDVFVQLGAVIEQFHRWIDRDIENDGTWWGIMQLAILVRAFNQYRSIVNLLRDNH